MGELEKYNVAVDKDAMSLEGDTGVSSDDALRLAQLGHTQELRRQYSLFSLCALCVCLMATWEALSSVVATALITGGAPCLFYNYSLGEIASIYPTAGGQYHWVAALAPASIRSTASWVTGWVSIGGQVVLTSSAAFAAGLQMQALIIVNNETYVPERWQGMLFYWLVLVYALALNIWGDRLLPYTNTVSGAIHVIGFVTIVVVLGVMAPKNSASFVFTEVTNSSGWSNDGVSWLVGLLSAVYPFLGVTVNGLMGLVYVIIFLFSTGPLEKLLATPTGFPFMQIFLDATKSQAGCTVLSVIITCTAVAATVAGVTSTSRTLWAFARDKSTPFDKQLSKVDKRLQIPVYAVVVVTVLQMLLGLIYLGNTTAFNAILSMSIIGMYVSYAFPIIAMLFARKGLQTSNGFGPFKLGHIAGPAANVISLIWITVVVIFSTFPSAMPVTPQNMNYSIVVMAGWLFAGIAYYVFRGKYKFEVPVVDLDVVEGLRDGVHEK
ncbi:hypothetical protein BFJ68_g12004 [Fusarium oxysporum]|uniref:Choline transport protein n=1 Tax=Fusarium oxysporum TaxID=5507 RepID=A0A420QCF6_FUSOX|nr:hypothetical protein BFJ68_g12004 [Fusarium oxysporum]